MCGNQRILLKIVQTYPEIYKNQICSNVQQFQNIVSFKSRSKREGVSGASLHSIENAQN